MKAHINGDALTMTFTLLTTFLNLFYSRELKSKLNYKECRRK